MSTLVIDTIQGRTTAGSVNVRGEGSNNTNLQQGLAKSWVGILNKSAVSKGDSLNVASLTDPGTGRIQITYTTNMSNATNAEYSPYVSLTAGDQMSVMVYVDTGTVTGYGGNANYRYTYFKGRLVA